jgi:hypothetical protein
VFVPFGGGISFFATAPKEPFLSSEVFKEA